MKLNPEYIVFDGNMFERLLGLLEDVRLPSNLPVIDMSIGEPKQPPAKILRDSVIRNNDNWQYYPKAAGNSRFVSTIHEYIARRWPEAAGIVCSDHIIPVPGTREPLHLLGNLVRGSKSNPLALITNPFYHAWRAGGVASGARIKFLNCTVENNFLPELDSLKSNDLENATVLYLCNPTNRKEV